MNEKPISGEKSPGKELKRKNRNDIYRHIFSSACVSKQDIASTLRLSLPTVTHNLEELSERGLIRENGTLGNTGGRRARGYSAVPDARVAVGVDVNHSHLSAVVVDLTGNILARDRQYVTFEKSDAYYRRIAGLTAELTDRLHIGPERLLGTGIGIQGIVSPDNRSVIYGAILGIDGETADDIGKYLSSPKAVFHDSDIAAFAEVWNTEDAGEAFYLSLSTNLGGAIVSGGRIFPYENFGKGRVEHMTLVPGGLPCYCGQKGCAEAYCSASVLSSATPDGRLETFFRLLGEGDGRITAIFDEYLDDLAVVINNVRMLFDCDVILGGYMGEYMTGCIDDLKMRVYSRNSFDRSRDYLRPCRIKTEPIAVGAALQYVDAFITSL